MPVTSPYPEAEIPNVDIWSFLFEREKDFVDSHGSVITSVFTGALLLILP